MASRRALAYQAVKARLLADPNADISPQELAAAGYSSRPVVSNGRLTSGNASINGAPVQDMQTPQGTAVGFRNQSPANRLQQHQQYVAGQEAEAQAAAPIRQQTQAMEAAKQERMYAEQRAAVAAQQQQAAASARRQADIARHGNAQPVVAQEHRQNTLSAHGLMDTPTAAAVPTPAAIGANPAMSLGSSAGRFMPRQMAQFGQQADVSRRNFYDQQRIGDSAGRSLASSPLQTPEMLPGPSPIGPKSSPSLAGSSPGYGTGAGKSPVSGGAGMQKVFNDGSLAQQLGNAAASGAGYAAPGSLIGLGYGSAHGAPVKGALQGALMGGAAGVGANTGGLLGGRLAQMLAPGSTGAAVGGEAAGAALGGVSTVLLADQLRKLLSGDIAPQQEEQPQEKLASMLGKLAGDFRYRTVEQTGHTQPMKRRSPPPNTSSTPAAGPDKAKQRQNMLEMRRRYF